MCCGDHSPLDRRFVNLEPVAVQLYIVWGDGYDTNSGYYSIQRSRPIVTQPESGSGIVECIIMGLRSLLCLDRMSIAEVSFGDW